MNKGIKLKINYNSYCIVTFVFKRKKIINFFNFNNIFFYKNIYLLNVKFYYDFKKIVNNKIKKQGYNFKYLIFILIKLFKVLSKIGLI